MGSAAGIVSRRNLMPAARVLAPTCLPVLAGSESGEPRSDDGAANDVAPDMRDAPSCVPHCSWAPFQKRFPAAHSRTSASACSGDNEHRSLTIVASCAVLRIVVASKRVRKGQRACASFRYSLFRATTASASSPLKPNIVDLLSSGGH